MMTKFDLPGADFSPRAEKLEPCDRVLDQRKGNNIYDQTHQSTCSQFGKIKVVVHYGCSVHDSPRIPRPRNLFIHYGTRCPSQNICLSYGFYNGIGHIIEPEDRSQ